MHWFGGSIAEAVTLSKQRNAIFVVFVEGDNELSVEMASTIDETDVVSRLSDESNFLAVKLKSGSTNYTHFAQIYQFVPVPSLFFIGRNGTPLEVVCAGVEPNNLATRIDRILEEHRKDNQPIPPLSAAQNIRQQTVNFLQTEGGTLPQQHNEDRQASETKVVEKKPAEDTPEPSAPPAKVAKTDDSPSDHEVVCNDGVCIRRPIVKSDGAGPSQALPATLTDSLSDEIKQQALLDTDSTATMEEKMERAKLLIEAKRREKAEKEKEAEKQKEIERRSQGKGVAELKRWQADQEMKQIQEERKREKIENNLARQRILEQIAQDRAERRAREAPAPQPPAAPPAPVTPLPNTSGDAGSRARIQLKLPDGTSHTAHFPADSPLADVRRHAADTLQLRESSISLWTAFPRRELTEQDASLRALQLAPSAALLVVPRAQPSRALPALPTPAPVAGFIAFLTQLFTTMILTPTQQLYAWLRLRIFPPPAHAPREASPSAPRPPPASGDVRRRGNIHRLTSDRPDDDNNTWNGNSTQQM